MCEGGLRAYLVMMMPMLCEPSRFLRGAY
jgi:hypothetical protein